MALLLATGLGACSLVQDEKDETAEQLYGRTWVAEIMAGQPAAASVDTTIVVAEDGKVNGNTGCNGYFGSVILDGTAMSFGNLGVTQRLCPEPASSQEAQFLRTLDRTRGYRLEDGRLLLLNGSGDTLAQFRDDAGG